MAGSVVSRRGEGGAIGVELPGSQESEGCPRDRADEAIVGAVSTLRLSPDPHLSWARRVSHEPWPGASAMANGRAAGARKRPRKRVAATRPRPQAPCGPNQVW